MLFAFIVAVHVIVSIFLIFVILLQPGKGDGMAAFGGGGNASSVLGSRGSVTFLAKVTEVCAAIFMLTSLALAYRSSHSDSVLRANRNMAREASKSTPAPSGPGPAAPAPGNSPAPAPQSPAPAPRK